MNYRKLSLNAYLKEIASVRPIPGGGSATAMVGAIGVALSLMVARITQKKAARREKLQLKKYIQALAGLNQKISTLIDKDPKVYKQVIDAYRLPRDYPRRIGRLQRALIVSYASQKTLCEYLARAHELNKKIFRLSRGTLANDLCLSEAFLKAAFSSAISTASLNADFIKNRKKRKVMLDTLQRISRNIEV